MKRELAPIKHKDIYSAEIERHINAYFSETIYQPLLAIIESFGVVPDHDDQGGQGNLNSRENAAPSAVIRGLNTGRIWYSDGVFTGRFSAAISRELRGLGAKWNPESQTFALAQNLLPPAIVTATTASLIRSADMHAKVESTLNAMKANLSSAALGLELQGSIDRILVDLTKQFLLTTAELGPDTIAIKAEITPAMAKQINEEFTQNLDKYIRGFTEKQIPELRERVAANVYAGGRADKLAKIIEADYGVAKRKAAFLGEQETSLLVSKYRESRYREIGAQTYRWSTSHDERVRPDHRELNGKIFAWASPPVTNRSTGATNNPGEDFRCRCVALPILEIQG